MAAQLQQSQATAAGVHELEAEDTFQDIELLQNHGINVADIKKLKSAGICTVKGIQMVTKKKLCNIKGLSEAKVDKMKEAVAFGQLFNNLKVGRTSSASQQAPWN